MRFEECLRQGKRALSVAGTKSCMCKEKSEKGTLSLWSGYGTLLSYDILLSPYQTEVASAAARIQDDGSLVGMCLFMIMAVVIPLWL